MTFDLNELLGAIEAARPDGEDDDAFTTQEFMAATGLTRHAAYEAIRVALDRGLLEGVRTARTNLVGVSVRVPGWRISEDGDARERLHARVNRVG